MKFILSIFSTNVNPSHNIGQIVVFSPNISILKDTGDCETICEDLQGTQTGEVRAIGCFAEKKVANCLKRIERAAECCSLPN